MPSSAPPWTPTYDFSQGGYNGQALKAQLDLLATYLAEQEAALEHPIRADDTLSDGIVRLRNLHGEVKDALAGLNYLEGVAAVATTNQDTSGLLTIDGVTLVAGDRVLLTAQTAPTENGIWIAAAGDWAQGETAAESDVVTALGGDAYVGTRWLFFGGTSWKRVDGRAWPIPTSQIADEAVTTAKIADANVTADKLGGPLEDLQTAVGISAAMAPVVGSATTELGIAAMGPFDTALVTATGSTEARSLADRAADFVNVKDFGAVGDGDNDDTDAIWDAIISLRANPVTILDTIGGNQITAYSSGVVFFPPGIYKVSADQLQISQDLGLTLRGSGSRRTNNAVRASTTLLVSGTSSGFGIRAYRSGARGLTIEDMDVCYETSAFTGSVLDVLDCPGVTLNRVFLGTYGLSAGTRLQTAAACIRSTYDEFMHFTDCVFDGAVKGWWSDDTRTELGNTFGGSLTKFDSCVFYDLSENHVYHGGNRTRSGVTFSNCAFNPIAVAPSGTCLNMDNVDGISVSECGFAASVSSAPAAQWLRITNSTGSIRDSFIDDLAPAGQIGGHLDFSGNRVFCTNGITVLGGVITGRSNEFSKGTAGWIFSPTYGLVFDVGPDLFKVDVTRSYDVPADSANLAGRISYDSASDSSVSKFRNTSDRVRIANVDGKRFAVASTPYTVSILDTGRTILATGGSHQTFTLPTPTPGTTITITKLSSVNLNVNCAGGTNYYGVGTVAYTGAALTGATFGTLVLEAYGTSGWIVKSQVNSWTFT